MWYQERKCKSKHTLTPKFQVCCHGGKAQLPMMKKPHEVLHNLLFNNQNSQSKNYQAHTRIYNAMFAFSSPGMSIDEEKRSGRGPPNIRIQGQVCHRIGSLLPQDGETPKFAQLYIFDTDNEVQNRMYHFRYEPH